MPPVTTTLAGTAGPDTSAKAGPAAGPEGCCTPAVGLEKLLDRSGLLLAEAAAATAGVRLPSFDQLPVAGVAEAACVAVPVPVADDPLVPVGLAGPVSVVSAYFQAGMSGAPEQVWLRASASAAVAQAAGKLAAISGGQMGVCVLDGWRPLTVQQTLAADAAAVAGGYVATPSEDPLAPPAHLSGGAVDVTLSWQGRPLALGTGFDAFCQHAHIRSVAPESPAGRLRRLLTAAVTASGFVAYDREWWHVELGTRRWAHHTRQLAYLPAAAPPAG